MRSTAACACSRAACTRSRRTTARSRTASATRRSPTNTRGQPSGASSAASTSTSPSRAQTGALPSTTRSAPTCRSWPPSARTPPSSRAARRTWRPCGRSSTRSTRARGSRPRSSGGRSSSTTSRGAARAGSSPTLATCGGRCARIRCTGRSRSASSTRRRGWRPAPRSPRSSRRSSRCSPRATTWASRWRAIPATASPRTRGAPTATASTGGSSTSTTAHGSRRATVSPASSRNSSRTRRRSPPRSRSRRRASCSRATAPTASATSSHAAGASSSRAGSPTRRRAPRVTELLAPTGALRAEVVALARDLLRCDSSNPPGGGESRVVALVERALEGTGIELERVARDPSRPNLVARLRGSGEGPTLAFLTHADVVPARCSRWSVPPFAAEERDGALWARGAVDMKCQLAAVTVALRRLAEAGTPLAGDVLLLLLSDEEVGDAGVGAPYLVEARPDLAPDYLVGEGSGERFETPRGPVYLLDCGVKAATKATLTVRREGGDASLPRSGESAAIELARLLIRLDEAQLPTRVPPELDPLLAFLAPDSAGDARLREARGGDPALDRILEALTRTVAVPVAVSADGPLNVVPEEARATISCTLVPGQTAAELEHDLRGALGDGDYDLEVGELQGGSTSPPESRLRDAIEAFLADADPEATLLPALGYGYSDCDAFREAYGTTAVGFIPFRHADALTNLLTKHGADERVLVDDLVFQAQCAAAVAQAICGAA